MNKPERTWRVDSASPVSGYFQNHGSLEVCELLMANSADSLRSALIQYRLSLPNNSNYKHSILLLDHSLETLFKARLSLIDKTLILKNKNAKTLNHTIDPRQCISRLEHEGILIDDNHKMALLDLRDVRNDIWHFGFLGVKDRLDDLISYCSCIYWVFMIKNFPQYGIRPILKRDHFETLLSFDKKWHFVKFTVAELMYTWSDDLEVEQDRFYVKSCKECLELSTIIDAHAGTAKCRCCGAIYKLSDYERT